MNRIVLKTSHNVFKKYNNVNLLVFDMAGTTVNEGGIVYETLFHTIYDYGLDVKREDIYKWHGLNKFEVLDSYLYKNDFNNYYINYEIIDPIQKELHSNFKNNLQDRYFFSDTISLIDEHLPELFNEIRNKNIKIALNTGYPEEIQKLIINKLNMNEFIDNYVSSEEVMKGRPEPFMIQELMKRLNIENPKTVMKFGDTKNDVLEGLNANCLASVGVLSGAENETTLNITNDILNSVMDIK